MMILKKVIFFYLLFLVSVSCELEMQEVKEYEIVVYGGTSAGISAAIQASRLGKNVLLISTGKHLGGLTTGGLGQTDIGNKNVIGGLAREFYQNVYKYYSNDDAWTYQEKKEYRDGAKDWEKDSAWWKFEPHVAADVYESMIEEEDIEIIYNQRLDIKNGVIKTGTVITELKMESGLHYKGSMFIDATYEGDLMAIAGISYTIGREANEVYEESLNGVQTKQAIYHQFKNKVDPYVIPGNPESGLLPGIQNDGGPGKEKSGDRRVQAYCFRMCLTDVPENKIPFPKPDVYNPMRYELLLRYIDTGVFDVLKLSTGLPNNKTDTNNKGAFATDNIGMNYNYPDGDYQTRDEIIKEHENYQKGLMWFLTNDERVPEYVREEVNRWGLSKDEFIDNDNWPHQLYIREARRMVSNYVMTEHNCRGDVTVTNSVGMAAYTMDSHNVQRYVDSTGQVRNEGDVQVGGFPPYPISYKSIIPKVEECSNLLVPVCLSASHIAFGSIRMEPVFMVLGQSAALAASIAIDNNTSLAEVEYSELRPDLEKAGQVLFLGSDIN